MSSLRRLGVLGFVLFFLLAFSGMASADEIDELRQMLKEVLKENQELMKRVKVLEERLSRYEERVSVPSEGESSLRPAGIRGLDIGLSVATVVQGVTGVDTTVENLHVHGGREPAGTREALTDESKGYAAATVDLDFTASFSPRSRAYLLLEMGSGHNPEDEIPSFAGIIDEAISMVPVETDDGDVRVSEAWYEQDFPLGPGKIRFRFGKVDITTDFDTNEYANDETSQFISGTFVNNIAVEWPAYGFGMMLWYEADRFNLGLGYADADGGWDSIFDYPFLIAELGLNLKPFGRSGHYRFSVWYNGEKHLRWSQLKAYYTAGINPQNTDDAWGLGVSLDQEIAEGLGFFLRYGLRDSDHLVGYAGYDDTGAFDIESVDFSYGFRHALSLGFQLAGSLWGRPDDGLGLGLGFVWLNRNYEDFWKKKGPFATRDGRSLETDTEYHLEVYYRCQVSDNLALTPDFQWTVNPAGLYDDGFWVLSLRGTWQF
ncbi:carbohydrate porin [Thermosulfuriphilus sp.]